MEDDALLNVTSQTRRTFRRERPSPGMYFQASLLFAAGFSVILGLTGVFALPDYVNGNGVDSVVAGYSVTKGGWCIWTAYPVLRYTINESTYTANEYSDCRVCGDYQDAALQNAQIEFPLGTVVKLWYLNGDPKKLAIGDPRFFVYMMAFAFSVAGLFLLTALIIHIVRVCCFGASTLCCKESETIRCRDPFLSKDFTINT